MKKKLIPVVALASVLGLAGVAVTACGPRIVEKEIHHYGIDLVSTQDVELTSESKSAVVGDTVTVKGTVKNPAISLDGLIAPGIEFTKVDEGTWTFVMPENTVRIAAKTSAVKFAITASLAEADHDKGSLRVETLDGTEVNEAGAGVELVVKYTATNPSFKPGTVKANDTVLDLDEELGGYLLTMPAKAVAITATLVEAKSTLTVTASHEVYNSIEKAWDMQSTALIYNLWAGETLLTETFEGSNIYENLIPGTEITLTTPYDTMNLQGGHKLKSATLNGKALTFEEQNRGTPNSMYIFAEPTFVVPTKDMELHFEFTLPDTVNLTVESTPGVEVSLVDPDAGMTLPIEGPVAKGSECFFDVYVPDGQVIDLSTSGIFDADGTLVGEFIDGEYGVTGRATASTDLRIVVNTQSLLEVNGLTGNWISLEAIDDSGIKKNSLTINEDASFEFYSGGAYSYRTLGFLTPDYENPNIYTWTSDDEKESLVIEPHWEVKGVGEDATQTLRWIQARHTKNVTVNDFVFTKGTFTTISNRTKMSDGGTLARVSLDYASFGEWMLSDEKGFRPVKFIEGPGESESFEYNKIYPLIDGEVETEVQYKSSKLNYPSEERGTYSDGSGIDVKLNGFGGYSYGAVVGKYELDTTKGTIKLIPDSGDSSKWVIDLVKHTLTEYIPSKDALSDVYYEFETNDYDYPTSLKLSFTNSDVFSVMDGQQNIGKSYALEGNDLTIKTRNGTLKLTVNPVNLELTVKSGYLIWSGDMNAKRVLAPKYIGRTYTPAEGQEITTDLVLGLDGNGTNGEVTGTYALTKIETGYKVQIKDSIYEIDVVAGTYKDVTPKASFDFMKGKSYKVSEVSEGMDDEMQAVDITTEARFVFDASALTVDVTIKEEAKSFAYTPASYEGKALAYVVDEQARTLTITVDETTSIVLNINPLTCTLAIKSASGKISGHSYALPTAALIELVDYKAIIKGNTYKATAQYTDLYDADNEQFYPVDNRITVSFTADGTKASVTFDQDGAGYADPRKFEKADCTYTISDAGEVKISLGSYKYLKININAKTGELKINGSTVEINKLEFGLGNSVLTKQA